MTRTLSRGLQQRLTIARMLLHEPTVLLLDEPYTGLDKVAADLLDAIMADARREGRCVLFSTHDLERGLAICDRAIIMKAGRVVHHARQLKIFSVRFPRRMPRRRTANEIPPPSSRDCAKRPRR